MKWRCALGLLVLLAARTVHCLPDYWIDPVNNPQPNGLKAAPACTAHPDAAYGDHAAPKADTTITFALAASGKAVTSVCPGKSYTLTVSWGTEGDAMVTTSVGSLSDSQDTCKNRAIFSGLATSYTTALAVPTAITAKSLELAATFAGGRRDGFQQATATIPVSSTCATTTTTAPPATTTAPKTPTPSSPADDDDKKGDDDYGSPKGKGSPTTTTPTPTGTTTTSTTTTTGGTPTTGTSSSAASASVAAFTTSMCKQPVQSKGASCTTSSLGYSCSHTIGGLTTHWTVGGCPPANPCTKAYSVRNSALNAAQQYLHYAATYKTTGYVSVGFARNPGQMAGTDAVLGWVNPSDGSPNVEAYHITSSDSLSARDKYSGDAQWLALSGASATADGFTTVCFSRPLDSPTSNILKTVPTTTAVNMNYAVGRNKQLSLSEHALASGYAFNPTTGAASAKDGSDKYAVYHGLLMALAWVVLAPLGVLFARHRWALGDYKLGKVHFWFHAHRAIQFLAVILFAGGLALAWTKLGEPDGGIGKAHSILAYLLLAMAGLQVVAAFIRPAGDAPKRRYWNLFHWNLGRLTLATGIINVFIGVVIYDRKYAKSVTVWFAVLGGALAAWVVAEVVLSILSLKKGAAEAAGGQGKDVVDEMEVANMGYHQHGQQQLQQGRGRVPQPPYPHHSANVV